MANLFRILFGYAVAVLGGYFAVIDVKPFVPIPFFTGIALLVVAAMIAHPAQAIPAFGYCVSGIGKLVGKFWPFGKKDEPREPEHVHRRRSESAPHHHRRHTPPEGQGRVSVSDFTISEPQLPVDDPRTPRRHPNHRRGE